MARQPIFLIIAGPNGAGKSTSYATAYPQFDGETFRIINPDLFTRRLVDQDVVSADKANVAALQRIEQWLETSLLAGHTIGVETVLSSPKYRRLLGLAHKLGYRVDMIYSLLRSPDLHRERVQIRVAAGGHDVPADKIEGRYWRSLEQLKWFASKVDRLSLFDNSGAQPRFVGRKDAEGRIHLSPDAPANLLSVLR